MTWQFESSFQTCKISKNYARVGLEKTGTVEW